MSYAGFYQVITTGGIQFTMFSYRDTPQTSRDNIHCGNTVVVSAVPVCMAQTHGFTVEVSRNKQDSFALQTRSVFRPFFNVHTGVQGSHMILMHDGATWRRRVCAVVLSGYFRWLLVIASGSCVDNPENTFEAVMMQFVELA